MTIFNAHVMVGTESTYNTPVTPTRSYEATVDDWDVEQQYLESVGFRKGLEGLIDDRVNVHTLGGTGSLQLDALDKGLGMILQGFGASVTGPAQQAATAAYKTTVTSTVSAPTTSFTVQVNRPDIDGTIVRFTHAGAVVTNWTISQALDDLLKLNAAMDFCSVTTATAEATPAHPANATNFDWAQCAISLNSVAVENVMNMNVQANLATKTNRRYLRGSVLKKQPKRNAMPEVTGTMTADFESGDFYDDFIAGNVLTDLVFTWTGSQIESPYNHELVLTFPAVQWRGETPKVSLTDTPVQNVPFKVLWDGTNPMYTIEYTSTDTTL